MSRPGQLQLRTVAFPSPPLRACSTTCHGGWTVELERSPPFGSSGDARAPSRPRSLGVQLGQGRDRPIGYGWKADPGTDRTLAGGPRSGGRKPLREGEREGKRDTRRVSQGGTGGRDAVEDVLKRLRIALLVRSSKTWELCLA